MVSKPTKMNVLKLIVVRTLAACVLLCFYAAAVPVIGTETKAIMYLQKYGYMKETSSSSPSPVAKAALSQALKDFQKFTGLAETGELDKPTLNMMSKPRCGVRDNVGHSESSRRRKRYALEGIKWGKENLTYRILNYPSSIKDRAVVDKEIAKAFKVWSDVSGLNFQNPKPWILRSKPVDITISFEKGKHGDRDEFDGPGGTLAHTLIRVGDVHFDDEEKWTIQGFSGISLLQIAVHEFGHSLGLDHSEVLGAVMFPHYIGYKYNFTLDEDDVLGIQKLYGPPKKDADPKPESKPRVNPDMSGAPNLCLDSSIDAATVTKEGIIYVFKENYYWEIIEDEGIRDGYPRKISDDWQGLPGNLDAAFTTAYGVTLFFKKNQVWKFVNKKMESGFPKNISAAFSMLPNDIDTAFVWNKGFYFFKGDVYWECFTITFPKHQDRCNLAPKPISNWKGLPINIDAAFQTNSQNTYIFKGSEYYRINDKVPSVDKVYPPYPRSTAFWWLECPDLCQDSSINAAVTTEEGQIYVFKGNYYWGIEETGISDGYPRKISDDWPGLPGDLDAAMTGANGKMYFFKKNLYWRFRHKSIDSGYPQNISDGFPGIPDDIDATFVWSLNGKAYFFKGAKYWSFDIRNSPYVSNHYPQPISNWEGVPNNIDAALRWRNSTYFFKGSQYYKWDDKMASIIVTDPPYPRSTYFWWFDCEDWKKNL